MAHTAYESAEGRDADDPSWQLIAESIPHIVWLASPDGRLQYMNRQAHEYTGWKPDASLDGIGSAILHPDDVDGFYRAWQQAVQGGRAYASEYRLRRADGAFRWHCGRGLPVRDADGEVTKWIGTATDIDDYKTSEAATRDFADRLAAAQRVAHVGSWFVDMTTGTRVWSDELYRLIGHEPQEFEADQERFFDRLHPEDAPRVRSAFLAQLSRTEPWEDEFRIVLPGGGVRWLAARTEPVPGEADEIMRVHGTAQDVTARKQAEEQLRFQADLLDAVGEAVIATDLTGTVIYWGPGAEELYGWSERQARGRRIMDMIPTVHGSYDGAAVMGLRSEGERWAGIMELGRRDGSTFLAEITRTPVLNAAGQVVALIGVSCDVGDREKAHQELEVAHRKTAEALTLLSTLQAEAPVGFAFLDRDLRFVRINRKLASIMGAPIEEMIGRAVVEVVPPALWEQLAPVYRHVLDRGEPVVDQRIIAPPGIGDPALERTASHYPVRIGNEIIGIGAVVHDITERVRAEGFRTAVMGQMSEGVYTMDGEGRLMYMNSAASRMLGWTESELRGKHVHELINFQMSDGTPVGIFDRAMLTRGSRGRLEQFAREAFTRKDGSTFPVAYSAVPLRVGSSVEGVAVVFRDVSGVGASPAVIRVLIADPDRSTSESFQALLDWHEAIEVVGVATTSASAVAAADRLKPDLVLVNLELPDCDGLATTVAIRANAPSTRVLLMTEKHDDTISIASIDAGCAGVLDKSRAWVDLVSAVRAAYHGETIISPDELKRVLSKVRGGGGRTHLTDREEEVLACIREGLPNAMVAQRLGVTPNTVRNHVQRILYKLNVHSKLEAVVLTSREGPGHRSG